jgi:hypothetical protein
MRMRSLWLVLPLLLSAACASTKRMDQFNMLALSYERAIRWSEFGSALALAQPEDAARPDAKSLQNIRILSYEKVSGPAMNEEGTEIQQLVEIRYTDVNKMNERSVADLQKWKYSEKDGRWILHSPFPTFR